ncbi:hypothetical protein [Aridibaculum aurantiacum]|uniref:hypothetical protein n=1 Tax=Aridibaculum aurantiacum TaxID=2810307 RepID=UPI001A97737A|nr:hypothetical protein [Aridibaculum aurantiacum]
MNDNYNEIRLRRILLFLKIYTTAVTEEYKLGCSGNRWWLYMCSAHAWSPILFKQEQEENAIF